MYSENKGIEFVEEDTQNSVLSKDIEDYMEKENALNNDNTGYLNDSYEEVSEAIKTSFIVGEIIENENSKIMEEELICKEVIINEEQKEIEGEGVSFKVEFEDDNHLCSDINNEKYEESKETNISDATNTFSTAL